MLGNEGHVVCFWSESAAGALSSIWGMEVLTDLTLVECCLCAAPGVTMVNRELFLSL